MAESFGAMTRRLRRDGGLTGGLLAARANVDTQHLLCIERGEHRPNRETVWRLAKALDLTPRQTDRYLFAAGFAPVTDWQSRAEDYAERLATIYGAIEGLTLPDGAEAHPFVRRSA